MGQRYHVIFSGKTKPGADPQAVASKLARALKKDESYTEVLLSGEPVIVSRTTNPNRANHVKGQLEKIGAEADIEILEHVEELIPDQTESYQTEPEAVEQVVDRSMDFARDADTVGAVSLKNKLQYRFDTFMAKGSTSSFKALLFVFVALFLVVAGLRGLLHMLSPGIAQQYESLDFFGNLYVTFLQLTDPGNMAQDILSSAWYKFFAIIAGLAGVIMLSALVAVITTGLDQKLAELKRGRSKVIEDDHTLIIGWDEQRVIEILRELVWANESENDAAVVILADRDKQEIDDVLRLRMPNTKSTRVVTRSGKGTILVNLDMVSIESAKSVIVLAGCADTDTDAAKTASDAMVIQTVLAATTRSVDKDDYAIVAEVYNDTYRDIIENTFPDYVVTLDTANILAKLLVQTSRSVGLSVVYNEILSFDGCEMYFYGTDWRGERFGKLAFNFPDGVPIGVRHASGELLINPPVDYQMQSDDEVLIVADDDSTIDFQATPVALPNQFPALNTRAEQGTERELIVGWNHKSETILREFSDYVQEGSEIDVVIYQASQSEQDELARIDQDIENIKINLIDINPLDRASLLDLQPSRYGNIIILASAREDKDTQQVDSENIVTLLLLRSIFQSLEPSHGETKLITEVLESQNYELIAKAGVKDMIISNRLVSMIMAQISESRHIKDVYDDIFQEDGSEIYLKPLSLYFDSFPVELSFADLIAAAQNREEVCFGVKIKALESDQAANSGVELIPLKDKVFTLVAEDCLVVVAEDEL
ncbi:CASTOR/POLLUX-related putative ion channel [Arenicella xantha]|uniref:Castor and Pollux protein voltage-gated ion channel component n=1 Tax=Arenicella xantha TaxID=644221 RepID=A0A395JSS4_9GAMM|nr:hypothetical protein [Arenicella xantha]RBP53595.1 Castor and Pollux protein voltage-gated ion channel component [Arenicella xantha]